MTQVHPYKRIALALFILALLPALVYTAYELNSLDDQEELISEIYRRQLDAILFSVNQYCWDVASTWAGHISMVCNEYRDDHWGETLEEYLSNNRSIEAVFITDSLVSEIHFFSTRESAPVLRVVENRLRLTLQSQPQLLQRLSRYRRAGYRKIEPLVLGESSDRDSLSILLLFSLANPIQDLKPRFVGIIPDPGAFIDNALIPKLEEIAGERFSVAVFQQNRPYRVFPPDSFNEAKISPQKNIWLFPQFSLGIRPRGQTIEELAHSRFYRDLYLILFLDLILVLGVWFVYRNIRREMELARLKSDLVSNISHELRTPLALIRMFSETLELERIDSEEKKHEYYKIISQESERLTHLVSNILNFSRIEAGRKEYHFTSVNLNNTVRNVLENYQFHLQNEGFTVETALDPHLPPVHADPEAMSESLINLVDNAVKYSEDRKHIFIRTGSNQNSVFLEVEDQGIGIDSRSQQKVFEKFYRASNPLIHNTRGSGLGLSLVKHIMEAHHGKIVLKSEPGKGSCFRLVFPGNSLANNSDQPHQSTEES